MNFVKSRIRDHQLTPIFLLALLISGPGLLPVFHILPGKQAVEGLRKPCVFGPALAGMNAFGNMISATPAGQVLVINLTDFVVMSDRKWNKLPAQDPVSQKIRPREVQ